jgi:hypothetical protein
MPHCAYAGLEKVGQSSFCGDAVSGRPCAIGYVAQDGVLNKAVLGPFSLGCENIAAVKRAVFCQNDFLSHFYGVLCISGSENFILIGRKK